MPLPYSCFAGTATRPWDTPKVDRQIFQKVLYVPIAHNLVTNVPIMECGEEFVDLLEAKNSRILPASVFNDQYKLPYDEYSKVRLGVYQRLLKMLEIIPKNIGVAYFEGLRPLSKQKEYFDKKFIEILDVLPNKEDAYIETTKHISPFIDNIPTHATGAAIDMTLFRIDGDQKTLLDMGEFDVLLGMNNQQETFSSNINLEQRKNRMLLLESAVAAGFANYGFEWWHYSYGDKMHALIYNLSNAIYSLAVDDETSILSITKEEYFEEIDR